MEEDSDWALSMLESLTLDLADGVSEKSLVGILRLLKVICTASDAATRQFLMRGFEYLDKTFQRNLPRTKDSASDAEYSTARPARRKFEGAIAQACIELFFRIAAWLIEHSKTHPASPDAKAARDNFCSVAKSHGLILYMLDRALWKRGDLDDSLIPTLCEITWVFIREASAGDADFARRVGDAVNDYLHVLKLSIVSATSASSRNQMDTSDASLSRGGVSSSNSQHVAQEVLLREAWPDEGSREALFALARRARGGLGD